LWALRLDGAERRANQKASLAAVVEREHTAAPGHNVDDEVGVLPGLVLRAGDVERKSGSSITSAFILATWSRRATAT
jgi:hypothetical protein